MAQTVYLKILFVLFIARSNEAFVDPRKTNVYQFR